MLITHGSNKKIIAFLKEKIKFINIDEGLNETLFNIINNNERQKYLSKKFILFI